MDLLAEEMSISGQYLSFCRNAHSVCLSQGNMSVQLYKILWLCLVVKLIGITIMTVSCAAGGFDISSDSKLYVYNLGTLKPQGLRQPDIHYTTVKAKIPQSGQKSTYKMIEHAKIVNMWNCARVQNLVKLRYFTHSNISVLGTPQRYISNSFSKILMVLIICYRNNSLRFKTKN